MSEGNTRHLSSPPERPSGPPAKASAERGRHRRRPGFAVLVLLVLGCFVLAGAALLRFFVADQILVAPKDVYTTTRLRAVNASYFDASTGQPRSGATLTLTSTVRGDTGAARGNTVVWDGFAVIEDLPNQKRLSISQFRMAFDRNSAALVNCCRATAVPPPSPDAFGLFFPVGVEKRTYNVYDTETRRAWPMRYDGTETIDGVEVYRYEQRVEETNTGSAGQVPAAVLGLPTAGTVQGDRYYSSTVTAWIEPRSGVLVDRRQQISSTLRGPGGQGSLTTAEIDLRVVEEDRSDLLDTARDTATVVLWLRTAGPITCLVIGLGLLAVAAILLTRPRRRQTLIDEPV